MGINYFTATDGESLYENVFLPTVCLHFVFASILIWNTLSGLQVAEVRTDLLFLVTRCYAKKIYFSMSWCEKTFLFSSEFPLTLLRNLPSRQRVYYVVPHEPAVSYAVDALPTVRASAIIQ